MALVILSGIIPMILTAGVLTIISRRSLLNISVEQQQEVARRIGDRIVGHVGNVKTLLLTIVRQRDFIAAAPAAQGAILVDFMKGYPYLMECSVLGSDGMEIVKIVRRGTKLFRATNYVNRSRREEFRSPGLRRMSYVGPVFFASRDQGPQMFISVPSNPSFVGDESNPEEFLGNMKQSSAGSARPPRGKQSRGAVLLARVSLEKVWELVDDASVGEKGFAAVVDPKGNLLAHPVRDRVFAHEKWADRTVVKEFLEGQSEELGLPTGKFHTHEGDEGERMVMIHHRIPGLGWGIIVARPLKEALGPVRKMRNRSVLIALMVGGLIWFFGASLVRHILEPLRQLQDGVQKIGTGDLKHRIVANMSDELQTLADEFNKMAESLESLSMSQRDLTHMIVHDLKSPLSGVLGCIDYVSSEAIGAVTPEQKKMLSLASKSGKDLLRLIQNLLDMAKMEEGRLEVRREAFSILELAAECVDDLEANIRREKKMVSVEIPRSLPTIRADRDLIYRVMTNLLQNALKHTPTGAEISLRARMEPDSSAVILSVWDNGEGISKEYLEKIFEKFGQAEGKKQKLRVGTGLGLTFCKLAVEAHGGKIWVESTVGKGSEFFVRLPMDAPVELSPAAGLNPGPEARGAAKPGTVSKTEGAYT